MCRYGALRDLKRPTYLPVRSLGPRLHFDVGLLTLQRLSANVRPGHGRVTHESCLQPWLFL